MRIEAELRPLQTQLRQASRDVTKFAADMNRSFGRVPNLSNVVLGGAKVSDALKGVEKDFERTFSQLRSQAKKGIINPTELADQLRVAVTTAKNQTQALIGQLQTAGSITGRQARGLIQRSERDAIKAETSILIGEAQHSLQRLENQFRATQTSLTQRRAGGNIGPQEFRALGAKAESEFNAGWDKEMRRFAQDPRFTEPMRQAFTRQFKAGGFGFDAASIPIAKSVDAAKAQASAYVQTYQKTVQSAKFGNLTGDLTGRQFKKALADANKELAAGLKTVRAQLDQQGLLTPEALKFLNSQFQNAGKTAATGFFSTFDKAMSENFTGLQRFAGVSTQVGGTLTKFLTLPLLGAAGAAVKLAGDAEQATRKLESTFGPFSQDLARQLAGLRKEIPATSAELVNMAATFGELLIPLGLAPKEVAKMSVELIKAAKNVAVFRGVSTERGFNAVVNALIGQSRELKKLGIEIDDRTIRDEAYRQGLARVGSQLSTTQKVMAGYSVIMQRTKLVANTLQDQQNTFNVRLLFLQASIKEAGIAFGTVLLPAMIAVVNKLNDLALTFQGFSSTTKTIVAALTVFTAVLGPLLIILGAFLRSLIVIRAAMIALPFAGGAGAAGASGGLAVALGITTLTGGQILAVVVAVGLLTAAFREYEKELGDFQGISNDVIRNIQSMTRSELTESAKGQKILENWFLAQRQALKQSAGITEGPFGFTTGGTIAQRQEFNRLGQKVEEVRAIYARINDEIKTVDATNKRLGQDAEAVAERWKAAQENVKSELLVETLAKARIQLRLLRTEATAASVAVNKGTTIGSTEMIGRGIEKARETLSAVEGLNSQFKQMRLEPENQVIGKELDEVITKTGKLRDELTALLAKSENTKVLSEFGARLAEIRKQLQVAAPSNDTELFSRAFGGMATLQEDLQRKITEAAESGQVATRARLNTMSLEIDRLRAKFKNFLPTEFLKQIDEAIASMRLFRESQDEGVITSTGIPIDQLDEQDRHLREMLSLQVQLSSEIVFQKSQGKDVTALLQKQVALTKEKNASTPNTFERQFGADFLPQLERVAAAVRLAQADMEDANLFGDPVRAEKGHLDLIRAQADLAHLRESLIAAMNAAGVSGIVQQQVLKQFGDAYKKAGGQAGDFAEKVDRGTRRLLRMGQLVAVIRQVAEAFGVTGGNIDKALTSLGTLLTSVESLRKANAEFDKRRKEQAAKTGVDPNSIGRTFEETVAQISAIVGIAVSAFNVVQSIAQALFGRSQTEIEHDRILQENNARLAELKLSLDGFTGSIGDQLKVAGGLSNPGVQQAIKAGSFTNFIGNFGKIGTEQINAINARLKEFGITWEQVIRVAKDNGITLLDSKGRLVAGAFEQLVKAVELNRQAFFKYRETLDDLSKKQELFNNVFNVPDTGQQAVQDQLAVLEQLAPDLFKQFFAGVDLNDATATEAALQALTQALLSGALEASDALKLLNRGELETIITNMANGFDKLRDATDKLTESELNVPTWFKRAQVRLESVAATIENATPPVTPPPTREPTPLTPSIRPPDVRGGQQDVNRVNSDAMKVTAMTADSLAVSRIAFTDVPPIPVTLDASSLPVLPPLTVSFDTPSLPDIQPVPVTFDVDALTSLLASLPAITLAFDIPPLPDIPPITVTLDTSSLPTTVPAAVETPVQTTRSANPSGVDEPTEVSTGDTLTVNGPLIGTVVQQPGESVDELTDRILAKLRRTRFMRGGSTSLPGIDE